MCDRYPIVTMPVTQTRVVDMDRKAISLQFFGARYEIAVAFVPLLPRQRVRIQASSKLLPLRYSSPSIRS